MSGGSFDYMYCRFEDMYAGEMHDKELDELIPALAHVLYKLEWWQSGDIDEESYREAVAEFKKKWLSGYDNDTNKRIERFKDNLTMSIDKLMEEL